KRAGMRRSHSGGIVSLDPRWAPTAPTVRRDRRWRRKPLGNRTLSAPKVRRRGRRKVNPAALPLRRCPSGKACVPATPYVSCCWGSSFHYPWDTPPPPWQAETKGLARKSLFLVPLRQIPSAPLLSASGVGKRIGSPQES